jgi:hypothetical protein
MQADDERMDAEETARCCVSEVADTYGSLKYTPK